MIRILLTAFLVLSLNSFALARDPDDKKVPIEHHAEHPDHIPHNGSHGKNPVKQTSSGDDEAVPRKRKYINGKQVIVA